MVIEVKKDEQQIYQCEACGFHYIEKEWAEKCEQWCRENNSCNLEITAHAVENSNDGKVSE